MYSAANGGSVKKKLIILVVVLPTKVFCCVIYISTSCTTGGIIINVLLNSLSHTISGAGTPSAVQVREALPGDTTVVSLGGVVMIAGTV